MAKQIMLTTVDNPFSPFKQMDEWEAYDQDRGYFTTALLARVARLAGVLSDADQERAIDLAIEEIARENVLGLYRIVTED